MRKIFVECTIAFALLAAIFGLLTLAEMVDRKQQKQVPTCKVCHCERQVCHQECGEENMCNLKCEGLCQRRQDAIR